VSSHFFPLFEHPSPQMHVPRLQGNIKKRKEEISSRSKYPIIAFCVISTSHFSCVINGYLLIPWSRKLLETLIGSKLVKKFPAFLGNSKFHFLKYCRQDLVISILVSASETIYIEYSRMPSHFYQHVINVVVSLPIRVGPGVFMNVSVLNIVIF